MALLKGNYKAILGGIFAGAVTSLLAVWLLAVLFQMTHEQYIALLPKSITTAIAKGIAIGNSSHAIGTTRAMEMGKIEGVMSSLSIVITGIITVVLTPVFAQFI